jgi:hypothetical protein
VRRWIEDLVQRDRDAYDARWDKLLSLPSESNALKALNTLTSRITDSIEGRLRQRCAQPHADCLPRNLEFCVGSLFRSLWQAQDQADSDDCPHSESSVDTAKVQLPPPVECLQLLYRLAGQVDALLRTKSMELALASGGCFWVVSKPLSPPSANGKRGGVLGEVARTLETWKSVQERVASGEVEVEWAGLKPVVRAKEKVLLKYQGDPSRLLDCCR